MECRKLSFFVYSTVFSIKVKIQGHLRRAVLDWPNRTCAAQGHFAKLSLVSPTHLTPLICTP